MRRPFIPPVSMMMLCFNGMGLGRESAQSSSAKVTPKMTVGTPLASSVSRRNRSSSNPLRKKPLSPAGDCCTKCWAMVTSDEPSRSK